MVPATWEPGQDLDMVFRCNRDAMEGTVSQLAATTLDKTEIPDSIEAVIGRDGTPNFIRKSPSGSREWFGGTSMPSISASEIPGSYDPGSTSIFFPAIGSGWELAEHLRKLPAHCAVIAWDADPVNLRLALSLCDLSEDLKSGRLVLLTGNDPSEALSDFLLDHPGYDIPTRMVIIPYLTEEQVSIRADHLNDAARRVSGKRNELAKIIRETFQARIAPPVSEKPCILTSTIIPSQDTMEWVSRIGRSASRCNPDSVTISPNHPSQCCQLGHMKSFQDAQPEMVLACDCFVSQANQWLNTDVPRAAWFAMSAPLPNSTPGATDHAWPVFCSIPSIRNALVNKGVDSDSIQMLGVATDPSVMHPDNLDQEEKERLGCDVAVLMDLPDVGTDNPYVNLESHVRLFRTLVQMSSSWMNGYSPDHVEDILRDAEKRADRHLTDDDIRNRFCGLIREVIAPAVISMDAVQRLMKARFNVKIWGRNWLLPPRYRASVVGVIPGQTERNKIFNASSMVFCPWFTWRTPLLTLDAIAAGNRVVCHKPEVLDDSTVPDISNILSRIPCFVNSTEAVRVVTAVLREDQYQDSVFPPIREDVLSRHTMDQRLAIIVKALQSRNSSR